MGIQVKGMSYLAEPQGQQLEQKQDRSPLLGPILQPQSPPPCSSSSSRQYPLRKGMDCVSNVYIGGCELDTRP